MDVRKAVIGILGWTFATSFSGGVSADDLEAQAKALTVIGAFARDTCGAIQTEGRSTHLELSGEVKAQLAGAIAKVADLGMVGAGKYKDNDFKYVLHEQLAQALNDGANCRLKVFEALHQKMIIQR